MKSLLLVLSVLLASFISPTPTYAQNCTQISDPVECAYQQGCRVINGNCVSTFSCSNISDPVECGFNPNCIYTNGSCTLNINHTNTLPEPQTNPDGAFSSIYNDLVTNSELNPELTTLSGIISAALSPWIFMFAGLILFILLIYGGFLFLTGSTSAEQVEKGKKLITSAFAGFIIIFVSFWIVQILEIVLGLNIL